MQSGILARLEIAFKMLTHVVSICKLLVGRGWVRYR